MKRLAALFVILMFVVSSSGCRRGLRLFGLRGAPCQSAPTAPAFGGGFPGIGGQAGAPLGGQFGAPAFGAPVATPTCCPPIDPCSCATGGSSIDAGYASLDSLGIENQIAHDGAMVKTFDSGMPLNPGETLGQVGPITPSVFGTATATAPALGGFTPSVGGPAALPPALPAAP